MSDSLTYTRAILQTTPARWRALVETLPAELLQRPPAPGEWSAAQCLQHLVDTEREVFAQRIRAIQAGDDFMPFEPALSADTPPPAELVAQFESLRSDNLKVLDSVQPGDMDKQANHPNLGPVTMDHLIYEWGGHDLMHLVQAEQALMQPFILGSGAWQPLFGSHFIGGD